MRKLLFGILVSGAATWLFRSSQARASVLDKLGDVSPTVRRGVELLAQSSARAVERGADVVDAAPLPKQVKDSAAFATTTARRIAVGAPTQTHPSTGQTAPFEPVAAVVPDGIDVPPDVRAEEDAARRRAAEALEARLTGN